MLAKKISFFSSFFICLMAFSPLKGECPVPSCECAPCECNPCACDKVSLEKETFLSTENSCECPEFVDFEIPSNTCAPLPCGYTGCTPSGTWLPELSPLFKPLVADPREITTSVGWRFNDAAIEKNVIDVSYGDMVPIYRWFNTWPCGGQLEIGLQGALWAVFDPLTYSAPLVNADYYIGLPISYAFDEWSFRLRFFHISSHIGDEYLLNHPGFDRRNPSAEYLDFMVSKNFTEAVRLYAGVGVVTSQDKSFYVGTTYEEAGFELRFKQFGFFDETSSLFGQPYFGGYFRHQNNYGDIIDQTYVLGYEWGKLCGLCRRLRIFMEYHDGFSYEGQFAHIKTNYFSIRMSYGF